MALTLHQIGAGTALRILTNTAAIYDKAAAHCAANKINEADMLAYRLAPDMFPLVRQCGIITRQAQLLGLLVDRELTSFGDSNETSFAELKARLARAEDFVKSLPADQVSAADDKPIVWNVGGQEAKFTGVSWVTNFILPNIWFHAATNYDILRNAGVQLGKRDFLGQL
jgi:hypothetical protein